MSSESSVRSKNLAAPGWIRGRPSNFFHLLGAFLRPARVEPDSSREKASWQTREFGVYSAIRAKYTQ